MASLFQRLLGPAFDHLPEPVRDVHAVGLPRRFCGQVTITPARGAVARSLAWMFGLPLELGEFAFEVEIAPQGERERWTRFFPQRPMSSVLWAENGLLCERLGGAVLRFRLEAGPDGIVWHPRSLHVLGCALPQSFRTPIRACEFARDGGYGFIAEGGAPFLGRLARYEGRLGTGSAASGDVGSTAASADLPR